MPFAPAVPWVIAPHPEEETNKDLKKEFSDPAPGTGTRYTSNSTTGISFVQEKGGGAASYLVTSIVASMPKVEAPAWLGQRPAGARRMDQNLRRTFCRRFHQFALLEHLHA